MQSVAVGWQIYAITGRPVALAWVGLAQFFPVVCLSLPAGQMADRFERRRILIGCHAATAALSGALYSMAFAGTPRLTPIYAVLAGIGVARAFGGPASQSILPNLVPPEHFGNAIAWGSSFWQGATVIGPMLGGIVLAATGRAETVYFTAAVCSAGACVLAAAMRPVGKVERRAASSLLAGIRYVWDREILLGSISLDLFAVLLGGVTALLPIFARDVLGLGPWALGALRSAPAAGAAGTGVALALWPLQRRTGAKMLACVALFGVATVVFGLSRNFALSLVALMAAGAADMVSVFVRSALVQLATPDPMRGRVSAVNMVFIGASNELGEFESGLTAQWLGLVPSVVLGGLGTIFVVALCAWRFPALRRVDRLSDTAASDEPAASSKIGAGSRR
jgi:MFS family permease